MTAKRRSLLAAVRHRRRDPDAPQEVVAPAAPTRARTPPAAADHELDQLVAEARYHRDRFELYRARVISASTAATSSTRLRELERTATGAEERLAQARRTRASAARPAQRR
jgi:hypothetical protein